MPMGMALRREERQMSGAHEDTRHEVGVPPTAWEKLKTAFTKTTEAIAEMAQTRFARSLEDSGVMASSLTDEERLKILSVIKRGRDSAEPLTDEMMNEITALVRKIWWQHTRARLLNE